ncbi:MAG TPA: helix-turn-helix transcriptional regulator, partial [Pseudonocardiaceae bacterium]
GVTTAAEHLHRALAEFDALGARAAAASCRGHLRATGTPVSNPRGRPAYGRDLSPRERQVLDLVTRGHTNREIATSLYLSERTVEGHVTRLLRKLGLRNRRDLWTAAAPRP